MFSSIFKPSVAAGLLLGVLALSSQASTTNNSPAFDGQYIQPNSSNNYVEWWWTQVTAEPVGDNPPASFQILFYLGYPFLVGPRDPSLPEAYVVINGFFADGTPFSSTIPAESGNVKTFGQEVIGTWANVGSFHLSPDFSTWSITLNAPSFGVEGNLTLSSNGVHHFACASTTSPYFSSAVPPGMKLTGPENVLFNQLGWATTIPGGSSNIDMMLNGTRLFFSGQGYHDANWATEPLNDVVDTWFFGSAQAGPYDLSYALVTPSKSSNILNTGYLSRNGVTLQNQCSLNGTKTTDISVITPYGLEHDDVAGVDVPTGFIIEYILSDREHYKFNLSSVHFAQNPDQNIYHRWVGTVSGGRVGETPSSGLTIFEWLNPGLLKYVPPSSI